MPYENDDHSLALDLTPFITAAQSGADSYAKIRAADAAVKAAKQAPAPTIINQTAPAAARRRSPLSYLLLAAAVAGVGYVGLRAAGIIGKRRRR